MLLLPSCAGAKLLLNCSQSAFSTGPVNMTGHVRCILIFNNKPDGLLIPPFFL